MSTTNTITTTTNGIIKRNYRKMPVVMKTYNITSDTKKAIIKAFKNVPKNAKKYNANEEKKDKVLKKKAEQEARNTEKKEKHVSAKLKCENLTDAEREGLIKVIYADVYKAVGNMSKTKMLQLTTALIGRTKNTEYVQQIKLGVLEKKVNLDLEDGELIE